MKGLKMGFLLSPAFILPFNLVTPYIFIVGVGLSVFEILIFIGVKLSASDLSKEVAVEVYRTAHI